MAGVVLYSKNYVQTNEVTDFCILQLKTLSRKRSNRFHEHTLAESERLIWLLLKKVILHDDATLSLIKIKLNYNGDLFLPGNIIITSVWYYVHRTFRKLFKG